MNNECIKKGGHPLGWPPGFFVSANECVAVRCVVVQCVEVLLTS